MMTVTVTVLLGKDEMGQLLPVYLIALFCFGAPRELALTMMTEILPWPGGWAADVS